jgi:hypothetical protein
MRYASGVGEDASVRITNHLEIDKGRAAAERLAESTE